MLKEDKTALICDLAETYHIYDYKGLPARVTAALAFGLRSDSRIKMKLAGTRYDEKTLLLAIIADKLSWLAWARSEDAAKGRNMPKSIYEKMTAKESNDQVVKYDSPEEFWAARQRLIGGL